MRLFTATLATETNTFSPLPTSLQNYKESVFFRPGEHPTDAPRMEAAFEVPPEVSHEPVVLTEVVGIQLFLMNILSPLTRGERLSPEQYQNIIKGVQAHKGRTTQELLAKRLNTEKE